MKNKYGKILNIVVYAIVVIFAILALSAKYSLFGLQLLVDRSGSMEPAIKTGSLVIDKSFSTYKVGDIITFQSPGETETVTHRIISKSTKNNVAVFQTEGDANQVADSNVVYQGNVLGKVVLTIPYAGYAVSFGRSWPGLIVLIIIPATIIVYDEFHKLLDEIEKKRQTKKAKKSAFE